MAFFACSTATKLFSGSFWSIYTAILSECSDVTFQTHQVLFESKTTELNSGSYGFLNQCVLPPVYSLILSLSSPPLAVEFGVCSIHKKLLIDVSCENVVKRPCSGIYVLALLQ